MKPIVKTCFSWIHILCLICCLGWGCAKKPIEKVEPVPEPLVQTKEIFPQETPESQKEVDLVAVLCTQALEFAQNERFRDALLIYNQALAQADDQEMPVVISKIEKVLTRADAQLIRDLLDMENLIIPEPLLMYWLGVNLMAKGDHQGARTVLEAYTQKFPDHSYSRDARDLIQDINRLEIRKDTIGCLLPLSGKYGVFGQRALKGIQMAVRDFSKNRGLEVKVIVKDTGSDPEKAAQCVEELDREKVIGIAGPLLAVDMAGEKAQELGIPMIALTQKNDFPLQGQYLFSNFITPQMQVQALGEYAFRKLGITKVAILYPSERYGNTYKDLFWDVADEFGVDVVGVEAYKGTDTDFTLPIQKLTGEYFKVPDIIKQKRALEQQAVLNEFLSDSDSIDLSGADSIGSQPVRGAISRKEDEIKIDFGALFIPDSSSRLNLILPQLAFNDARGMVLLGTNLWHDKGLLKGTKGYNRNAVITDGYFGGSTRPATIRFEEDFTRLFQESPGFLEAVSYDTAYILFNACQDETVNSRTALRQSLLNQASFNGVTGNTIFDQSGAARKELFLITVKRGRFAEIAP